MSDYEDSYEYMVDEALAGKRKLSAEVKRLRAENERLRAALEPFVFDEDELFETHDFQDNELIFLRPKDGNDSVQNGWRKTVTFANVRRAADALKGGELYDANSVEGGMVEHIEREIRAGNPEYTPDAETVIQMANRLDRLESFITKIATMEIDALSPMDALTKLYELQRQAQQIVKS